MHLRIAVLLPDWTAYMYVIPGHHLLLALAAENRATVPCRDAGNGSLVSEELEWAHDCVMEAE